MAKDDKDGQEQQDDSLINAFKRISAEGILRDYEKKNRDKINDSSLIVKDAFDKQWRKVTGNSYYQPVTTVQPPIATLGKNNTERSDPRSRKYMANVLFGQINWSKVKRKMGKKFKELYILEGEIKGTDTARPIFQNLDIDRLKTVVGAEADKIILEAKTIDHGEIKGSFNLQVEGYWEVMFSPAKSENDPIDVRLMWEGQCLIIKRMLPVVLPGFYLEVADNATRDHFIQTPEAGRKKIGVIQEYPYTVLREAGRDEFLTQKAAGDRVMKERIAREDG